MAQHRVVLLPGDGIGPEITASAAFEVASQPHGFELIFEEHPIGGSAIDATESLCLTARRGPGLQMFSWPPSAAPVSTACPATNGRSPVCSA